MNKNEEIFDKKFFLGLDVKETAMLLVVFPLGMFAGALTGYVIGSILVDIAKNVLMVI